MKRTILTLLLLWTALCCAGTEADVCNVRCYDDRIHSNDVVLKRSGECCHVDYVCQPDYVIESDSEKVTVLGNPKYNNIDKYIRENIGIADSPSHKKRNKSLADLIASGYKEEIKNIVNSYGIDAKAGIFVIDSNGKLEALSLFLRKDNTVVLPIDAARCMFEELFRKIEFPPSEDNAASECITVGFQ